MEKRRSHSSELMFLPRESGMQRAAIAAGRASARQMPRMIPKARGVAIRESGALNLSKI